MEISLDESNGSKTVKSEKTHCESREVRMSGVVGTMADGAGAGGVAIA